MGSEGGGGAFGGPDATAGSSLDGAERLRLARAPTRRTSPSGDINVANGGNAFRTNPSVDVAQGDTLDFVVGFGGNGFDNDSTALDAVVCSASPDGG